MEEIEKEEQGMQEKLSQVTKMVIILIKGKGITKDPSSRDRLASWKNNDGQFNVPNPNDLCEQEKSVWTIKIHQRAVKMQPFGQEAKNN